MLFNTLQSQLSDFLQACTKDEWPNINLKDVTDDHLVLHLTIPNTLSWFAGHFPEQAVLPGIVQTHWAAILSQKLFNIMVPYKKMGNIKFQKMILPEQSLFLKLIFDRSKGIVSFRYTDNEETLSEGKLYFKPL